MTLKPPPHTAWLRPSTLYRAFLGTEVVWILNFPDFKIFSTVILCRNEIQVST